MVTTADRSSMTDLETLAKGLTAAQREAVHVMFRLGNNPYGWSASDAAATGRTMSSLEAKGLLTGGHVYGARQRTYRYTDKAVRIRTYLMENPQ